MRVLILGGGIGGLGLALGLGRRGVACEVHERTREYKAAGAAITLWPNGLEALRRLDGGACFRQVLAAGWRISTSSIRRPDGRVMSITPVGAACEAHGLPAIAIHRANLQGALLGALGEPPRMERRCVRVRTEHHSGIAEFADGTTLRADLVVGADGLHSVARSHVTDASEAPRSLGFALWRGTCELDHASLRAGHAFETWADEVRPGCGVRFGMVQIDERRAAWYAAVDGEFGAGSGSIHDAWEHVRQQLLRAFEGWHDPIEAALRSTAACDVACTPILDRPVPPAWVRGRVVLLGDAAHPMTPDLGQGACSAIEDAADLAERLEGIEAGDGIALPAALAGYVQARRGVCERRSRMSRRLTGLAQARSRTVRAARDVVTRLTPGRLLRRALARSVRPTGGYGQLPPAMTLISASTSPWSTLPSLLKSRSKAVGFPPPLTALTK